LAEDGFSSTLPAMTYVYVIESVNERQQHYVGMTADLKQRLTDHNDGKSPHTRKFKPWHLVVYLGFADEQTARDFEKYLKSGSGKAFLHKRFLRNPKSPL
jgi:predicted GIY-YIG superfamily endonuclease